MTNIDGDNPYIWIKVYDPNGGWVGLLYYDEEKYSLATRYFVPIYGLYEVRIMESRQVRGLFLVLCE